MHPVFKKEQANEFLSALTQGKDSNAIVLDPSISWENMLALDFAQIAKGNSLFFDKNDFADGKSIRTKLFGIQASSTSLLTTIAMLKEFFNINLEQALLFVDPNNFPLPETFNMVVRDLNYSNKTAGYNANVAELEKIYRFFIYSDNFPKLDAFKSMSEFLNQK
ncbi:hypothetical protein ACNQ1O_01055 [Mycoplasma sp. B6188]|uniref:hypothetical protein n=1 Tax=Mycoplasma sp. B6188 TaxID=3401673 RepID=UPI003AAC81F1